MIIARPLLQARLEKALAQSPAVALLGPRQAGKTTLAKLVASRFPGSTYLDAESSHDQRKLDDARSFLSAQRGRLTIIDEVQRMPQLFTDLRGLIDERRQSGESTGQFLLLGSASLDLVLQASETLAGRVTYLEMGPLSVQEALSASIPTNISWLRGGFPDSLTPASEEASYVWRQNFIRSYLERDVPMFAPRMPAATIGRLWTMLAHGQASQLNSSRLAQALGISAQAVTRYIDLLVDLMLVRRLLPWSGNIGKRLVRSPKVYVRDSGLVHALLEIGRFDQLLGHPVAGASWEGLVIENIATAAGNHATPLFYRTADGAEIDLIFERAGRPFIAIEIKLNATPKIDKRFMQTCDELKIENRLFVSSTNSPYPARDGVIVHSLDTACSTVASLLSGPFG